MLVSDAVSLSGMKPGVYDLHIGGKVVLTEEGKLHLADNPKILAGSAQMLAWGINRLMEFGLCSLNEAWNMASIRPAAFMGLASGLAQGAPADLTLFDYRDNQVRINETFKAGQRVYIA